MIQIEIALKNARTMIVWCGGCMTVANPTKVIAIIPRGQYQQSNQYAIVEFSCYTPDCGHSIQLEVDI